MARKSVRTLREQPRPAPAREAAERLGAAEPVPPRPVRKARTPTGQPNPRAARVEPPRRSTPKPLPVRQPLPPKPKAVREIKQSFEDRLGAEGAQRASRKLDEAKRAFNAERFAEASRALTSIGPLVDDVPEVRELKGLALYRMGRWREAIFELEAFRALAGTPEQNPVLQDCYRALRRWSDVEELWIEVRDYSPSAELVNEGRIVMAGALADQGRVPDALALLERKWKRPERPREHHLRRAYATADLYERSGAPVKARELFAWIARHDRDFADARDRAAALR